MTYVAAALFGLVAVATPAPKVAAVDCCSSPCCQTDCASCCGDACKTCCDGGCAKACCK